MGIDTENLISTEAGIAAAATAVLFSPAVRKIVRRALVLGLASAFGVGGALQQGARRATTAARSMTHDASSKASSSGASGNSASTGTSGGGVYPPRS